MEGLDKVMEDDISSIPTLDQLHLVEEVCGDSYRTWSRMARSVIESSENGTIDRRNFEERLKDLEWMDAEDFSAASTKSVRSNSQPIQSAFRRHLPNFRRWKQITYLLQRRLLVSTISPEFPCSFLRGSVQNRQNRS